MIILFFLVFGMFAGWLANLLLRGEASMGQNLIAGLAGSLVGGTAANLLAGDGLDIAPSGLIGSVLGAVVVLAIWRPVASAARPVTARGRRR